VVGLVGLVVGAVLDRFPLVLVRMADPPGIAARGDVDLSGVGPLTVALERVAAECSGDVVLECSGLEFVGIEALRALVEMSRAFFNNGRRLVLQDLSPHYARVFTLTGWDQTPGLVLRGGSRLSDEH
jgi:anti-anti-sigma factor